MIKRFTKYIVALTSLFVLSACQSSGLIDGQLVGSVTAVGSSALLPLVEVAAEEFQTIHPEVLINVQGGGSGQGLSQIVAGTVEMGNSDVYAQEKKIDPDKYNLQDNRIAVVGVGVIVNKEAGVTNLSNEELIKIFTGEITNWNEVGGNDVPIVVINRASGSGSRALFERYGLQNNESMTAQEQDNSGTVRKLVTNTKGAISYVSFSYFSDDYVAITIDNVAPTVENVATNDWKIWAYEHVYTSKDMDAITEAFIEFLFTDTVQEEIIPQLGYIPVSHMKVERSVDDIITPIGDVDGSK